MSVFFDVTLPSCAPEGCFWSRTHVFKELEFVARALSRLAAFLGSSSSHFPGKDHKSCATPLACELRVDQLLPTDVFQS